MNKWSMYISYLNIEHALLCNELILPNRMYVLHFQFYEKQNECMSDLSLHITHNKHSKSC